MPLPFARTSLRQQLLRSDRKLYDVEGVGAALGGLTLGNSPGSACHANGSTSHFRKTGLSAFAVLYIL